MTSLKNQQIELSKLVIHPNNVRVDQDADAGIEALARNIEAFGLFQNLVVQPLDDGRFGVLGGGRRLKALQTLDADARLDLAKVPCRVVPKTMPWQTAISLAENAMQARMNPIDEFEAFAAMVDQGQTVEQIALAFGITVRQVTERLRYGRVHADI
ncbi:MAG: ParB/Srx family N-terminal domain-containing protein, partial [Pseudomonadota bacterium]